MCLCVVVVGWGGGGGGHEGPLVLERHFEGAARDERTPPGIPASQPVDALWYWRYWEWSADGATPPLEDGSRKGHPYRE